MKRMGDIEEKRNKQRTNWKIKGKGNLRGNEYEDKKKRTTKSFVTRKGVRQGCVLSPLLFDMKITDLDKYL